MRHAILLLLVACGRKDDPPQPRPVLEDARAASVTATVDATKQEAPEPEPAPSSDPVVRPKLLTYIDRYDVAHRLPARQLKIVVMPTAKRRLFERSARAGDIQFFDPCPQGGLADTRRRFLAATSVPTLHAYRHGDARLANHKCSSSCCTVAYAGSIKPVTGDDELIVRVELATWRWLMSIRDANDEVCLDAKHAVLPCNKLDG